MLTEGRDIVEFSLAVIRFIKADMQGAMVKIVLLKLLYLKSDS